MKQFGAIAKASKKDASRILDKIEKYAEKPEGRFDIKQLKGKYGTLLRLRIGNYRVIFELLEGTLFVYEIIQRQKGYK